MAYTPPHYTTVPYPKAREFELDEQWAEKLEAALAAKDPDPDPNPNPEIVRDSLLKMSI